MNRVEFGLIIGIWVVMLAVVFVIAWKRSRSVKKYDQELANKVLDPAFIQGIQKGIHDRIEQSVHTALENFTRDNESLHLMLKETVAAEIAQHMVGNHAALAAAYEENIAAITETSATANAALAQKTAQLSSQLDDIAANVVSRSANDFSQRVEQVTREEIPQQLQALREKMSTLTAEMDSIGTEVAAHAQTYQAKVNARVSQLIDEQAVEVLANYLNASLAGIDFGEQQDFILNRLEENKNSLKEELGA